MPLRQVLLLQQEARGSEDRGSATSAEIIAGQPPASATLTAQAQAVTDVAAHDAAQTHHYVVHFPSHPARESDPHYADFAAYHRRTRATARCWIGDRTGFGDCRDAHGRPCPPPDDGGEQPGLELHHAHVEFSLQNGISLTALEKDYPGISDPSQVGAWVESGANFRWLCCWHHRGPGGAHTASHADFEASAYILGLISGSET